MSRAATSAAPTATWATSGGAGQEGDQADEREGQADGLGESRRLGRLQLGGRRQPGPDERAEEPGVRRGLHAAHRADREQDGLHGEQDRRGGLRQQQDGDEDHRGDAGSDLRTARVEARRRRVDAGHGDAGVAVVVMSLLGGRRSASGRTGTQPGAGSHRGA